MNDVAEKARASVASKPVKEKKPRKPRVVKPPIDWSATPYAVLVGAKLVGNYDALDSASLAISKLSSKKQAAAVLVKGARVKTEVTIPTL